MSGGEPSSIKWSALRAAGCLHLYTEQRITGAKALFGLSAIFL